MKVAIIGATGNVGTSLVEVLSEDPGVTSIIGIARRRPDWAPLKTEWIEADVVTSDLAGPIAGCDVVVHLAWAIQPSRDQETVRAINVDGSRRVFEAVAEAGVENLVYASSVGTYSPGPKSQRVTEEWPTGGISTSFYSRHKSEVERILDDFEVAHPGIRVVRLRPGLIFKRESASGQRRLFIGPLLPTGLLMRKGKVPVIPKTDRLVFQAVHSLDVAEAYRLAVVGDVRGAFNVASEPVLDVQTLAAALDARKVPIPPWLLRVATQGSFLLHLHPTPAGWVDMGLQTPLLDTTRARQELGWEPRFTAIEAIRSVVEGMGAGAGKPTPPLVPDSPSSRLREVLTGIGHR